MNVQPKSRKKKHCDAYDKQLFGALDWNMCAACATCQNSKMICFPLHVVKSEVYINTYCLKFAVPDNLLSEISEAHYQCG